MPYLPPTGSGGGGSFDPHSPGPIGDVTPGGGAFSALQIGGGDTISKIVRGLQSSSQSIPAASYWTLDISTPGVLPGNSAFVNVYAGGAPFGIGIVIAYVTTTVDTVSVTFYNTDLVSSQSLLGNPILVTAIVI